METIASSDFFALRYPIGEHQWLPTHSIESRSAAIDHITALPASLRHAIAGLTLSQLDTPYRPDGWTVRQVVHHVADAHAILYTRVKIALTEETPQIKTWDEIPWAELPDATAMPIDVSLSLVDAVHARFVYLLNRLTPAHFARRTSHPVWGVIPVDALVDLCAWHGRHHVAHISELRRRRGWH